MNNDANNPNANAENPLEQLLANLIPTEEFNASKAPPAPDYKDKSCWAACITFFLPDTINS
jgi:hypothetical protein